MPEATVHDARAATIRDRRGGIGGGIVDDDDLVATAWRQAVATRGLVQVFQRRAQQAGLVVGGNDEGQHPPMMARRGWPNAGGTRVVRGTRPSGPPKEIAMSIRRTVKTPPLAALAIALSAPWLGALAAPPPGAPQGPDSQALEQIAQRVVTQSAAVGDGDVVLISGRMQDAELMEDIAVNVARAGGQPLIAYGSDRLSKRMFFDVPAKYDDRADTWGMQMADMVDVFISLGNGTSEALLEGADPARLAARNKANAPVTQAIMKNNVRRVELGNNLYPTPWRAERFGMEEAALSKMFWNGINVDYGQLQARGAEVKAALAGGDRIRITHPNGTDLSMRVQGRPVGVSDGIISQEDRKAGGAAVGVYLPAGEVYTTPVPGSTNGTLVDSGSWFNGKRIDKLTLKVVDGKVTEMSGSGPGYAGLKAQY